MATGIPATHTIAQDQKRAMREAQGMQNAENHGAVTLQIQDDQGVSPERIYIYNILNLEWVLNQPPQFASLRIPACEPGNKFAYNMISRYVNEVYTRTGTTELYYKKVDGRKYATSLLNPSAFPGIDWNSQLNDWATVDQFGNDLNAKGVFWSLTRPDETEKLQREINLFRARATKTMNALVKEAERLAASDEKRSISPLMHFAMDYLGISAGWHTSLKHMISCPNCGDPVQEGIAYHRNVFGEKCIIDMARYEQSVVRQPRQLAEEDDEEETAEIPVAPPKKAKRRTA